MIVAQICNKCLEEGKNILVNYKIDNDGYSKASCVNNHINEILVKHDRCEVLFQLGLVALTDGYYREAIMDFAAALERFYEFTLKVFARKVGIDSTTFEEAWKGIGGQSERQLGAFMFSYLNVLKESPKMIQNARINSKKRTKIVEMKTCFNLNHLDDEIIDFYDEIIKIQEQKKMINKLKFEKKTN